MWPEGLLQRRQTHGDGNPIVAHAMKPTPFLFPLLTLAVDAGVLDSEHINEMVSDAKTNTTFRSS